MSREEGQPAEARAEQEVLAAVALGGARFERLVLTRNRLVVASVAERGLTLRLHEAFRAAPDEVLRAVGQLFSAALAPVRARARAVLREYLSTAQLESAPTRRRGERRQPADQPHLERLRREFDIVNRAYFGDRLPTVPIRLSGRMRRRNGHFCVNPVEIAISRMLCERGAAGEAERTLRHEMIHLWQFVQNKRPGHGADFRRWARRLSIHPRASRVVRAIDS